MSKQLKQSLVIQVLGSPTDSQAALTALNFAQAAVSKSNIKAIFFNSSGVTTASTLSVIPQDELDLNKAWIAFKQTHGTHLYCCISASFKRGIINSEETARYEKTGESLASEFALTGLGTIAEYLMTCDKTISFK